MTSKQKQCLLVYLGYDTGGIDGIWGSMSQAAAEKFAADFGLTDSAGLEKALTHAVAYGMPTREESTTTGDFWDEIQYFTRAEFACKCGCGADEMEESLIQAADAMRSDLGRPMTVSSGRRCATHNAAVGGVSNSRHLTGKAMDFSVSGATNAAVEAYLAKLKANGTIRYWYNIDGGWYHMDVT